MTKMNLLQALKEFTEESVRDIILPVRQQEKDKKPPEPRSAGVHLMRLVKSSDAQKVAPYIIHQIITGKDSQPEGEKEIAYGVVRSIFCVYNENAQEGSLALLGIMERLRINLLETVVIANQFKLVLDGDGLESLIYPDDTGQYYAGEMISTWRLPGVERKVNLHHGY